jgi:hypothetical protein
MWVFDQMGLQFIELIIILDVITFCSHLEDNTCFYYILEDEVIAHIGTHISTTLYLKTAEIKLLSSKEKKPSDGFQLSFCPSVALFVGAQLIFIFF